MQYWRRMKLSRRRHNSKHLVVQRLALVAIILVVMGQVQSTEMELIADEGELTDDEMNVASGAKRQ